ncbi:MAG: glutaminyl-peptide cyclotransferase [Bacteroidota bacterium]
MKHFFKFIFFLIVLSSCKDNTNSENQSSSAAIPTPASLSYTVLNVHPHDTNSFTEGLIWLNGSFLESTGEYKKSYLLKVNLETGKREKTLKLGDQYFGEGIAVLNNKIYQLTYREHKVFVYDMDFKKLPQEFEWPYEGWGMTTDGKYLIIDTGGSNLYFVNPETFKIERTLGVVNNNGYVSMINELEYVDGYLYANIYETNYIIKINPQTGLVEAKADLSDILKSTHPEFDNATNVLNGIAYNAEKKTFYITGKNWPSLFEIKFN